MLSRSSPNVKVSLKLQTTHLQVTNPINYKILLDARNFSVGTLHRHQRINGTPETSPTVVVPLLYFGCSIDPSNPSFPY